MAQVADTLRPTAQLWASIPGFVVPRSYERRPGWADACAASSAEGWPVQVRHSGGGLVPQGPGLWNLSLAWPVPGDAPVGTEAVYQELAGELATAFARLGIRAEPQAVAGSFCDGRFNLAVNGRKVVGTAQAWRRIKRQQVVLAHAIIVSSADAAALADAANRFEARSGGETRYRPDALTSLARAWCEATGKPSAPEDFDDQVVKVVSEQFARVVPPKES